MTAAQARSHAQADARGQDAEDDAAWLQALQAQLAVHLGPRDEAGLDGRWARAQRAVADLALRPGKRLRPRLLRLGFRLAGGRPAPDDGLLQLAAGLELLHAFMLIHDDVADRADTRRGGPTLQRLLGGGMRGNDLAVVAGDHLFARAVELMLTASSPHAALTTRFMLRVCRHTAVGQYLDIDLAGRALAEVTPLQTLRVARLKTANYSLAAPLQVGALWAGGSGELVEALGRIGRAAGVAYQLRDDLLGVFGNEEVAGKSGSADLVEGKRTLPLVVAHRRASEADRWLLDTLHQDPNPMRVTRAREVVRRTGAATVTLGLIDRATARARRHLALLPDTGPLACKEELGALLGALSRRKL